MHDIRTHPLGSPAGIADCQARVKAAQLTANRELARQLRAEEGLNADDFEDVRDYDPTDDEGGD